MEQTCKYTHKTGTVGRVIHSKTQCSKLRAGGNQVDESCIRAKASTVLQCLLIQREDTVAVIKIKTME